MDSYVCIQKNKTKKQPINARLSRKNENQIETLCMVKKTKLAEKCLSKSEGNVNMAWK